MNDQRHTAREESGENVLIISVFLSASYGSALLAFVNAMNSDDPFPAFGSGGPLPR